MRGVRAAPHVEKLGTCQPLPTGAREPGSRAVSARAIAAIRAICARYANRILRP